MKRQHYNQKNLIYLYDQTYLDEVVYNYRFSDDYSYQNNSRHIREQTQYSWDDSNRKILERKCMAKIYIQEFLLLSCAHEAWQV